MAIENDEKRLFFGAEVKVPWPDEFPPGRMIQESDRHITLAFLGNNSISALLTRLSDFPNPEFILGPSGICDKILFLPTRHPRVAAFQIQWLDEQNKLQNFQQKLVQWLESDGYNLDKRELLSHVTIARSPFERELWENSFKPLPLYIKAIHLYESIGNLRYMPKWSYSLLEPFEEMEHTADIAYKIRGENYEGLYHHAMLALCFSFPSFTSYFIPRKELRTIEDVIAALNQNVAKMDAESGIPFKAVSYHGESKKTGQNLLEWEMIVDV